MLRQYNFEQKQALIALFIFNVPLESSDGEVDIEYSSCNSWRDHAITSLTEFLCVPDWTTNQIAPLLATDYALSKQGWVDREQRSKPYSTVLDCRRESSLLIYASLLIHLVQTKQFDGRGSVLMRNLVKAFGMTEDDGIFLESQLSTFLVQKYQELAHSNEKTKDSFRYAKIGAAAVGAGALLFFTAGLVSICNKNCTLNSTYLYSSFCYIVVGGACCSWRPGYLGHIFYSGSRDSGWNGVDLRRDRCGPGRVQNEDPHQGAL